MQSSIKTRYLGRLGRNLAPLRPRKPITSHRAIPQEPRDTSVDDERQNSSQRASSPGMYTPESFDLANAAFQASPSAIPVNLARTGDDAYFTPPPKRAEKEPSDLERSKSILFLYAVWSFCCWIERAWKFGMALILAPVEGGFYSIALLGFLGQLAMFAVGPSVGKMLDKAPRDLGLKVVLTSQNISVALSAFCILHAFNLQPALALQHTVMFPLLILLSMVERVANGLSDVVMERDWVVALSGAKPALLSRCNAMLRRLDLFAELFATFLFGLAVSAWGSQQVLWWSACLVLVVIPLQNLCINLMTQIAGKAVAKDGRKSPVPGGSTIPVEKVLQGASTALKDFAAANLNLRTWTTWDTNPIVRIFTRIPLLIATLRRDWAPYFKQQNLPASLAYISLFLNPVLSPGGLMTAFLASQGVGGTASALFRSACAVTGFVGTQLGDIFIGKVGLLKTGVFALVLQSFLLIGAGGVYAKYLHASAPAAVAAAAADFDGEGHSDLLELFQLGAGASAGGSNWLDIAFAGVSPPVLWFCGMIVLSRIGLWMYDMVNAQIFQTVVPHRISGTVSASEVALCSLAELAILGVAAALSDPQHFGTLVLLSVSFVCIACALYCLWVFMSPSARKIDKRLRLTLVAVPDPQNPPSSTSTGNAPSSNAPPANPPPSSNNNGPTPYPA